MPLLCTGVYEGLKTLTEKSFWRLLFKGFKPVFYIYLYVLRTKFDPSTCGPVDGAVSESYWDNDTPANQKLCPITITRLTFNSKWDQYYWLNKPLKGAMRFGTFKSIDFKKNWYIKVQVVPRSLMFNRNHVFVIRFENLHFCGKNRFHKQPCVQMFV